MIEIYIGLAFLSFIACLSIIFPIPYTPVLFSLSSAANPLLLSISATLGSVAGEMSGYIAGFCGRRFIGNEKKKRLEIAKKLIDRYGALGVFLFALTPMPDDLLLVPLGLVRYPLIKVIIPMALGKFIMHLTVVLSGREIQGIYVNTQGSVIITVILTAILFGVCFALLKIDWEKRLKQVFE